MNGTSLYDLDLLRRTLEKQYEMHTAQLTTLAAGNGGAESDEYTRRALVASSQEVLSGIAQALRRMAMGTYGVCERCQTAIPVERLEILPHTRFCAPCRSAGR